MLTPSRLRVIYYYYLPTFVFSIVYHLGNNTNGTSCAYNQDKGQDISDHY